ncbi:MAG: SGNH/GDSL hydrolase family protein [Algoriphagus sp.]|nr:SGNH/GDSL hydrolase family protein [Algoriphagus sp.]
MYWFFRLKLLPYLPFLINEASGIRRKGIKLPSIAENLSLGSGTSTLLILGESTASGVGASSQENTLAGNFHRILGTSWEIKNIGKNGLKAGSAYEYYKNSEYLPSGKISGLVLFLGANDCFKLTAPSVFHQQLKSLIDQISSELHPDWIYLADIPPVHLFPAFSFRMRSFLKEQRNFLQKEMTELSREHPNLIFEPISLDLSPDFFSQDQIHPSDLGYQKIAEFAVDGIRRAGFI